MTANMLVTLPWTPARSTIMKINSDESIKKKTFTVTINGKSYTGNFADRYFWKYTENDYLSIYIISDDNEITVDNNGNCPSVESIKLKIDGRDVLITLKS